ncbi:MAG: hypothetical protein IPJ03_17710 [Ignavibacteriales bacterium]|nr:hypothetical protein [Ignavibacteriales bacterium]
MKQYKFKIARFTPDGLLLWSVEGTKTAANSVFAERIITNEMTGKGYVAGVDYEIVSLAQVDEFAVPEGEVRNA